MPISNTFSQSPTAEDSLQKGLLVEEVRTLVSGYGEGRVNYDLRYKTGKANLTRFVLFLGHQFNKRISFFSETEIEDARIEGGTPGGEIALEQAYLKFDVSKNLYLQAGLFIPRIGIINENHLPTTFNGNDRPFVEQLIIPSTWRELGVGVYGTVARVAGLNYSFAIMNGLNSAAFEAGSGLKEGRFEGQDATASNIAITGSLQYLFRDFRFQASGYFGGSAGLNARQADSLQLESGLFGTPVALGEANIQYNYKRISFRGLAALVQIPDAEAINRAYASNTPETMVGGYAEVACNLLREQQIGSAKLEMFVRYENLDLNLNIPINGISNDEWKQQYVVAGLTYLPVNGVALKADFVLRRTGNPNPALVVNPFPQPLPFYKSNSFFNLGFGYSF